MADEAPQTNAAASKASSPPSSSCKIRKLEEQPCNATDDNPGADCYETVHTFKKIRTSSAGLRKSPNKWTKEENQKLAALVACYGEKKWKRISSEMGGLKTGAQCAQHWKRVLSPEIRKGHWDENEEELLLRLVVLHGSCWKKIAKKIPQRTDIQCRYQYLKAKQSREVLWDPKEDEALVKKVVESTGSFSLPLRFFNPNSENDRNNTNTNNVNNGVSNKWNFCYENVPPPSSSMSSSSPSSSSSSPSSSSFSGSSTSSKASDQEEDEGEIEMDQASPSDSGKTGYERSESGAEARNNTGSTSRGGSVVWLEISEHMARMKITSTLRTALECKTRFLELMGDKTPTSSNPFIGHEFKHPDLKSSGGIINDPIRNFNSTNSNNSNNNNNNSSTNNNPNINPNISININNSSGNYNNNINITNVPSNITININNINNNHGLPIPLPLPLPVPLRTSTSTILPVKLEDVSSTLHPFPTIPSIPSTTSTSSTTTTTTTTTTLSTSTPPHFTLPSLFSLPENNNTNKKAISTTNGFSIVPARIAPSGLDSLAAVASTLPRELFADCG